MLRNREGFTLIELLIVVVIIGILAAIALPKFGETRERAYESAMQSDLRNLQTAQEMYYNDGNYDYVDATLNPGVEDDNLEFTTSDGVTIEIATSTDPDSYTATATHEATAVECTMQINTANAQGITCEESGG